MAPPIYMGDKLIGDDDLYLGGVKPEAVYVGSTKVWPEGGGGGDTPELVFSFEGYYRGGTSSTWQPADPDSIPATILSRDNDWNTSDDIDILSTGLPSQSSNTWYFRFAADDLNIPVGSHMRWAYIELRGGAFSNSFGQNETRMRISANMFSEDLNDPGNPDRSNTAGSIRGTQYQSRSDTKTDYTWIYFQNGPQKMYVPGWYDGKDIWVKITFTEEAPLWYLRYNYNYDIRLYFGVSAVMPPATMDYTMDVQKGRTNIEGGTGLGDEYGFDTSFSNTGDWSFGKINPVTVGAIHLCDNQDNVAPTGGPVASPSSTQAKLHALGIWSIKCVVNANNANIFMAMPYVWGSSYGNVTTFDFQLTINGKTFYADLADADDMVEYTQGTDAFPVRCRQLTWVSSRDFWDTDWPLLNGQTIPFTIIERGF